MSEESRNREILSAALSAHVSELRLFWREASVTCRWLVPDAEHCTVDEGTVRYLKAFREKADQIVNEDVRKMWLEKSAPVTEAADSAGPFPIRTLTWLLRVAESPHRDDLSMDSWNLYLWNVRLSDLPSRILHKLSNYIENTGKLAMMDFDALCSRLVLALQNRLPEGAEKFHDRERQLLIHRFDRLRRFRNLIFYGVPNIGKANLSKELIRNWKSMTGREIGAHCVTVFHPNVSYGDMIERRLSTGQSRFLLDDGGDLSSPVVHATHIGSVKYFFEYSDDGIQEGLFLALCRAAAHNPDRDYVFMIDCIDEARVSDVFGEVGHMLDSFARVPWHPGVDGAGGVWDLDAAGARSTRLTHSGRVFFIPSNVYVLGTANEENIWHESIDSRLIQSFALERLDAFMAEDLRVKMLADRSMEAFARLEEYVGHSVALWDRINSHLIAEGGHRNLLGYGPLFSMCEEILESSDVHDANRIVLGTWRYRMMPPLIQKMENMLKHSNCDEMGVRRRVLDELILTLNQSWLRLKVSVEGIAPYEALEVKFQNDYL